MVSLDDVMLKFSRQFSQEYECPGIWWFPEKRVASGFWTLWPYTKNFVKTFILKFPRNAFSKESLRSAIWKASGKEKLIRFLEKVIS